MTAPTMQDVRLAAEAIVEQMGATQVRGFGSVIEGTQTEDSDIDLFVLFDDIDYRERRKLRRQAEEIVRSATGHTCDVFVTDFPEWEHRVANVSASFEATVAEDAVALIVLPHEHQPRWGKEIGMPDSNLGEAVLYLRAFEEAVGGLANHLGITPRERSNLERGNYGFYRTAARVRLTHVCEESHLTVETGIKVLARVDGIKPDRIHDIEALIRKMPGARQEALRALLDGLDPDELSRWRTEGTYPPLRRSEEDDPPLRTPETRLEEITPHYALRLARAAGRVAGYVHGEVIVSLGDEFPNWDNERTRYLADSISVILAAEDVGILGVFYRDHPTGGGIAG